ncbi:hypothetical protein ABPG72_005570 [Tetrahymena utriculariae]
MSYYSPTKQQFNQPLVSDYEGQMATKIGILRKEFSELDISHEEYLTKIELFNILDSKIGKAFDRDLGEQLYQEVKKDQEGKVLVDDFIKVVLQAEKILYSKIHNTKKALDDINIERKNYITKFEEVSKTEVLNNYGVMQGAYLEVTVISGRNLSYNGSQTDPFITMILNGQRFETGASSYNPSQTYTWQNASHKFQVFSGQERLQVFITDFDQYTKENFIGQIDIPLKDLDDQYLRTKEYQIYNQNGAVLRDSYLVLQLQYVHSNIKFLEAILAQKKQEMDNISEDLIQYERDIEILYQPFKTLQRFQRDPFPMMRDTNNGYPMNTNFAQTGGIKNLRVQRENEQIKSVPLDASKFSNVELYTRILTISLLVILLIEFFEKSPYYDLLIIFYYVGKYELNELNEDSCTRIIAAYIFSILFEIFWLIFFAEHWWNPQEKQMYDTMLDSGFRKANVVISFITVINKIFLVACFWGLVQYYKNNPLEEQIQLIKSKNQISPRRQYLQEQRPYLENQDFKVDKIFITPEKINTNKSYITYQDQSVNQYNQYYQPKY